MSSCLYELDEEMPGGPWNVMDEKAGMQLHRCADDFRFRATASTIQAPNFSVSFPPPPFFAAQLFFSYFFLRRLAAQPVG